MATTISAQDFYDRDSLWQVFEKSKPDTNRVHLYIQLGQQYETNNPDSALLLYEQAAVPVLDTDTEDILASRVLEQEHVIYPRAVRDFIEGRYALTEGRVVRHSA